MAEPSKSIDAVIRPAPLTLGQIALLERIDSPLLHGRIDSLADNLASLWLLSLPRDEAANRWHEAASASIAWGDTLPVDEYRRQLDALLSGILAFFDLLPAPENGSKKNTSETASLPSSPNGPATSTDGRLRP